MLEDAENSDGISNTSGNKSGLPCGKSEREQNVVSFGRGERGDTEVMSQARLASGAAPSHSFTLPDEGILRPCKEPELLLSK